MKKTLTLILAGAAAFAFSSCTTVVHPTETRTVYKKAPVKRSYSTSRPASVSTRIYDSPETTTVVRPAE